MKSSQAFLVRCWREPTAPQQTSWRFLVTEIGAAPPVTRGFTEWAQLVEYLAQVLLPAPASAPSRSRNDCEESNSPDKGDLTK